MEKRLLQRQQLESAFYYADEREKYKKIKTNLLLVIAIVTLCISMRLSPKIPNSTSNESTKQRYFDVPSRQMLSNFSYTRVA
ncbi:hypothetical protein [Mucilaginibacter sp. UR6-11]|uniref:hypothetical protein n=1 Tax=Mucilaginibacter sp. UR6-11 TaxID=1435644 RepID=UPI001E514FDD|nr:hypothetical protein [Mucilaginibacter sp. UR6-11]MCC8426253.1 hypothetical protein [Mucilaginibacter sp. UR6-11]